MKRWLNYEHPSNKIAEAIHENKPLSIECPSCSSVYFEEIKCSRFSSSHTVAPSQPVPYTVGIGEQYRVLRCVKCSELLEPKVTRPLGHKLKKPEGSYSHFLSVMSTEDLKLPEIKLTKKAPKKTKVKKKSSKSVKDEDKK